MRLPGGSVIWSLAWVEDCALPYRSREKVLAAQRVMTAKMEEAGDLLDSAAGERALQPNATPRIPWKTGWLQEQPEARATAGDADCLCISAHMPVILDRSWLWSRGRNFSMSLSASLRSPPPPSTTSGTAQSVRLFAPDRLALVTSDLVPNNHEYTAGPGQGSAFHFDGIYMCRAGKIRRDHQQLPVPVALAC